MRRSVPLLRIGLVWLAWFAQLCLPLAHAAMMNAPASQTAGWCGDPLQATAFQAYLADLPDELREGIDGPAAAAGHLDACAKLCAVATTPAPTASAAVTGTLRAAGLEPAPLLRLPPVVAEPAPRPPAQGPPARA